MVTLRKDVIASIVGFLVLFSILLTHDFTDSETGVFYKHYCSIYWGPEGTREKVDCGFDRSLNVSLLKRINMLNLFNWHHRVLSVGDVVIEEFSREFYSRDQVVKTYQLIRVVTFNGRLIAFSNVTSNSPGPGAFVEECISLQNGTEKCSKTLVVYDIDSEWKEEFTFYYDESDPIKGCEGK